MGDLISRQEAVSRISDLLMIELKGERLPTWDEVWKAMQEIPSALPERKMGKWILVKGSNGKDYHKCSECLHTQEITGVKNYCAVCGADMIGVG